ncbi:MAG: tyrosine-type recombinase/integrase, partial [Planctomycetota bacterium]
TLSAAQKEALIQACPDHLGRIIIVALGAGLRRGELLALQWEQVNFDLGVITIERSKSGRIRHVPMTKAVYETLEEIAQETGHVFTFKGKSITTVRRSFATAIRRVNRKAAEDKKAGREAVKIGAFRFHDLRHTFVTDLFLKGGNPADIQALAGHSDIKTTMRYAHPSPESMRNTINLLDTVEPIRYCIRRKSAQSA